MSRAHQEPACPWCWVPFLILLILILVAGSR